MGERLHFRRLHGKTAAVSVPDASEVWASAGTDTGAHAVHAALRGYGTSEDATLHVFSMTFEPITSECNALGKIVNPSCAVINRSSYFKATVIGVADSDITWTASPESAGLQTRTGQTAEVIPTACGECSLMLQVGDYERAKGFVKFLAVEETTTEIRAFILGENNTFHITAADVTNYVATVNHIYEQVGMKFTLHSVTSLNVANPDWLNINNQAWTERMRFSPSCSAAKGRSGKRNDSGPPTVSRSGRSAR